MTLNMVRPKNILATLKYKIPRNISNIKQVRNICVNYNKAVRKDRTKMQLLKLLDDNNFASRYGTCEDGVTVQDIFWTHPGSIKLFNNFILYSSSTQRIRQTSIGFHYYKLLVSPLQRRLFFVGFTFLESEKEENVSWVLEVCRTMLKDKENMPKAIVTGHDTALMDLVEKVFPTSYALLCRYHITKNVRSIVKPTVGTKQIKVEDKIIVKGSVIVERIMDALTMIINASTKEVYVDVIIQFRRVKLDSPIQMDEVCTHWKVLRFNDDGVMKDDKSNISILTEWEVIHENFLKVDDNIKLHIKEQLRKLAYPEITDKPPSQPVKIKGAPKKVKSTPSGNSMMRSPSYFEHVDKLFPDSPTPESQQKKCFQRSSH
ncbi:uncharacterized protein LOC127080214 [Lathyrus oleraceus]|uniref:uncharacterized protein LOC127080214 n=1 Tax=Pisum sativum TaxID=3888 RepID=UPI0021D1959C|nr:uncharacterized protein LOC127080214 [Pisum sativum]